MTRSKPLRRTPLKRKARLRPKRSRPRRSGRVRDREYLLRVKGLPCCLDGQEPGCFGPVDESEADHAGPRPLGRKADDSTAIPLCMLHHHCRTNYIGFFKGWTARQMRAWCDERIAETRAALNWKAAA